MKKSLIFILVSILLAFLLAFPVLAIETTLKQEYRPGQTLIAEISGNFIKSVKASDILFYSGRLYTPMIYDLAKIQDSYYLYAILPNKERNYTLIIKNAHYLEAGQEKREDLKFNFSVSNSLALFTVNPGFIITNKNFNVKVESKLKSITIKAQFLNSTQEIEIRGGRTKTLTFSVSDIKEFTFTTLIISAEDTVYEIPVAVFKEEKEAEAEKIEVSENLRFSKSRLNFSVLKDREFLFELALAIINTGQEDIKNITLVSELEIIKIHPEEIGKLEAGSSAALNLTIISAEEGIMQGSLLATTENYSAELLLSILTLKEKQELENLTLELTEEKTCEEMGGKPCKDNEICEGISKLSGDGLCCLGKCKKKKAEAGKTWALILILVIIVIIAFFVYKKLKTRRETSRELLEKKSKRYEERFKTGLRGSLTRV